MNKKNTEPLCIMKKVPFKKDDWKLGSKRQVLLNKIGKRNFVNSLYLHTKFVHMMISYTS